MRKKNYEMEAPKKDKSVGETSNPLTIEKPVETKPKIPKGVFKKNFITLMLGLLQTTLWLNIWPKLHVQCLHWRC